MNGFRGNIMTVPFNLCTICTLQIPVQNFSREKENIIYGATPVGSTILCEKCQKDKAVYIVKPWNNYGEFFNR